MDELIKNQSCTNGILTSTQIEKIYYHYLLANVKNVNSKLKNSFENIMKNQLECFTFNNSTILNEVKDYVLESITLFNETMIM